MKDYIKNYIKDSIITKEKILADESITFWVEKAVKLNNGFIDRLCNGLSLSEEYKQIIRDARQELSETRNIQVIKPCK